MKTFVVKTLLITLVGCAAFSFVRAQNPVPKVTKVKPGTTLQFKDGKYFLKPLNDTTVVFNNLIFPKKAKPGVYRLPQDNMPCIVPDTKDIAVMPNAFKGTVNVPFIAVPPRIPNAVVPKAFPNDTQK